MKFSSQEEYGLRCLLRIARDGHQKGLTIPEISHAEGITTANVAKLLRILRLEGFLESARGQVGGYSLSRPADKIYIREVLDVLGGRLYDDHFCENHTGIEKICTNSIDCSIRSLWQTLQNAVDSVLTKITLKDLISSEEGLISKISNFNKEYINI
ncbi:MAG: RrF2 family transcriptional regulator [Ignavibacteria bacterium]